MFTYFSLNEWFKVKFTVMTSCPRFVDRKQIAERLIVTTENFVH